MKRFLVTILAAFFACSAYAGPLQYLHGQTGRYGQTGGGGAEITGQTEVIATYGEAISAGDPVMIRKVRLGDYTGLASPTFIGLSRCGAFSVAPAGTGVSTAFSSDGRVLAMGHTAAPYLTNYLVQFDEGLATYTITRLNAITGGEPPNYPYSVAVSPNGEIISVGHYQNPCVTNYRIRYVEETATYTFTKMTPVAGGNPGNSDGVGVGFSPNGEILAVGHSGAPYITTYRVTYFAGLDDYSFSKNAPVAGGNPAGLGRSVAFSPDGKLMAVGHDGSPYVTVYEVAEDAGVYSFAKLSAVSGGNPGGSCFGVKFSPDGKIMSVAHTGSPYLTNYGVSFDEEYAFDKLPGLVGGNPEGDALGLAYSPDGRLLAVSISADPYMAYYRITFQDNEYIFTKQLPVKQTAPWTYSDPAFSPDSRLLVIPNGYTALATKWDAILDEPRAFQASATFFDDFMLLNQIDSFGYAMETGIASECRAIMKIFDLR